MSESSVYVCELSVGKLSVFCMCNMQVLSRPYMRSDNRAVLSALNDSVLREFLKLLPVLQKPQCGRSSTEVADMSMVSGDMSMVSVESSVLSQLIHSFSCEMHYVLSRHRDSADVVTDRQCCKLLAWLPCVSDVCSRLLCSDNVSYLCSSAVHAFYIMADNLAKL